MSLEFLNKVYCGIQIGFVHAGYPCSRVGIHQNHLVIESLIGKYSFKAKNLIRIESKSHWIGTTYILRHSRPDYPQDIQLIFIKDQGKSFFNTLKKNGFVPMGTDDDLPLPRSPIAFNIPRIFSLLFVILQLRFILNLTLFCLIGLSLCYAFEKNTSVQSFFLLANRYYSEVQQWNRSVAIMFTIGLFATFF